MQNFTSWSSKINKITYLFGAGASCGTEKVPCLPLVKDIALRLRSFRTGFDGFSTEGDLQTSISEIRQGLVWLEAECENHSSIDTFAKKLFLKGDKGQDKLYDLKCLLTLFFIDEQFKRAKDFRYDSFFASILGTSFSLPKVQIISWNYDHQFELSFRGFTDESLSNNQNKLGVITPFNQIPQQEFSIYKLNGSATFYEPQSKFPEQDPFLIDPTIDRRVHILKLYKESKEKRLLPAISFAWEEKTPQFVKRNVVDLAREAIKGTDVLVVIGYSMPFFNREVDSDLIRTMNLKKVYIQDLYPIGIKERFLTIKPEFRNLEIVEKTATDQFLLPGELIL